LLIPYVPALAQKTTGDITGTVTDSTGALLPGAALTAVCTETNLTRTAVTDSQGGFRLSELPICPYRVTAELRGFKTVTRETELAANAVAKVDFRLEVGSVSETVTVEGVSPLVEFSDKLNNRVDSQRIGEIPLSRRDFTSLLTRSIRKASDSTPSRSMPPTSACRGSPPRSTTSGV
jgi:hypothetical protein